MQHMLERDELHRRVGAAAGAGAHLVEPTHQAYIEVRVVAHAVIDPLPVFEQAGQNVVDVGDGIGVGGTKTLTGTVGAGAAAGPALHNGIAVAAGLYVIGPRARGRHDGQTAFAHHAHQLLAAPGEFLVVEHRSVLNLMHGAAVGTRGAHQAQLLIDEQHRHTYVFDDFGKGGLVIIAAGGR